MRPFRISTSTSAKCAAKALVRCVATRGDARNADNVVTPDGGDPLVACGRPSTRASNWRLASSAASLTAAPVVIVVLDPAVTCWRRAASVGHHHVDAIDGTPRASAAICAMMVVEPCPTSTPTAT